MPACHSLRAGACPSLAGAIGISRHAKWRLWPGRWQGCLIKLARLSRRTEAKSIRDIEGVQALRRHVHDLIVYLEANRSALVDYGARRRQGKPISTAFVETAINVIVARRMTKKQQMRWNRWAVQPFLDVRVAVPEGILEALFRNPYPGFRPANDPLRFPVAAWPPDAFAYSPRTVRG